MNTPTEFASPSRAAAARRPPAGAAPQHKLIITGTGRAGTTFLVRLLTACGQDTGYNAASWRCDYFPHCAAGLERHLADPRAPYIVKDPELCVTLEAILKKGQIVVDHAIVPVRDLESAALSRVRIGGTGGDIPGGLVGTSDPGQQQAVLAERFHTLVHTLVAHDIPHTFLLFPRFAQDAEYAFGKLRGALPTLDRAVFMRAFAATANPELIHSFSGQSTERSTDAAQFEAAQKAKRQHRRRYRVLAWATASVAAVAGVSWCSAHGLLR